MKYLIALPMVWSAMTYAQCTDVFGRKSDCPSFDDSLTIYNNAVKVYDFFEKNGSYKKIRTVDVKTDIDKREVFNNLQMAKKMFFIIRKEVNAQDNGETHNIKDISYSQYYQEMDRYRFSQRELENQIINADAPAPIYDNRISPIVVNEYKCLDSSNIYFGDIVNIPMYIPVVIKPVALLTASERRERNEILKIEIPVTPAAQPSTPPSITEMAKAEPPKEEDATGIPVYAYNNNGTGGLIGFIKDRTFRKVRPSEYQKYALPRFAQELLNDHEAFAKWFKIHYGAYDLAFR